jgi:hypothetical protein
MFHFSVSVLFDQRSILVFVSMLPMAEEQTDETVATFRGAFISEVQCVRKVAVHLGYGT